MKPEKINEILATKGMGWFKAKVFGVGPLAWWSDDQTHEYWLLGQPQESTLEDECVCVFWSPTTDRNHLQMVLERLKASDRWKVNEKLEMHLEPYGGSCWNLVDVFCIPTETLAGIVADILAEG